ncbi:MAG TPA: ABC transporter ATP-binding protein [Pyrinomonadaceae bacterium]|nr:ABC transporter ATP-binding protein [Pyrinomonadaceae bacterium]
MKPIIKVEKLSKQYCKATRSIARPTLREAFIGRFASTLSLRARSKNRGDRLLWALRDVSFEIGPGEVVGIIGRNGAGKSTLLKILSRVTKPTAGYADIYGTVGSLMEIGTGFHPDLTGRENIYLNGALLGMKQQEIARRFDEIVSFAEMEQFLDMPVKRYSTGMYLRLAFAVAAHLEPEILLLDEVLAVGDTSFQNKCLRKMKEVSRQGRTVLFVSHNMAAIQQMCSRVFLIQSGRLSEEGTAASVLAHYLADASRREDGDFDLSNHPARLPGCSSVIKRLRLYNDDGRPTMSFHPDETMIAEIEIKPDVTIREPRVALSIEDSTGQRITTAATYFQQSHLPDITAPSRIRCRFPPIRLGSGEYLLSISIDNKYLGMIDGLHNAARFEVVWRNNFGNGEAYSPIYGPVLTTSTWERVD